MSRGFRYDAVVIGAGSAGLVAATRLAQAGASVAVLAKGVGCTHLAAGTVDVLGYAPELVSRPLEAVAALTHENPQHPYARIGQQRIGEALRWLQATLDAGPLAPYTYVGDADHNGLHPTALGALRPSALVPSTMAAGERTQLERVCIVGTPALRDFHPSLCAANLSRAGVQARAVSVELELERADMSTLGIARRLEEPRWRAEFCARLTPLLRSEERVGLPAMLGLREPHTVHADLEHRLGRRVFEIPSLPPSVAGMRLYESLRAALRAAGGRLMLGAEVVSHTREDGRLSAVQTGAAGHAASYSADAFVLASGGFASGAIELDSHWATHERVLGLALDGVPAPGEPRFLPDYQAAQPLASVGVAVDAQLRALGASNVYVAGASLPGAVPWREASGEGIAVASGFAVAQTITGGRERHG